MSEAEMKKYLRMKGEAGRANQAIRESGRERERGKG